MNKYFTISEFAALKNTTRQTIYNSIKKNNIEIDRLYGKILIRNNKKNLNWQVNIKQQHFKKSNKE